MESERRRYLRGNPKEEILAIMAPTPTLARVKDLGQGGLRLEYITGPQAPRDWSQVNLFLTESKMYLSGLPFRLVYDRRAEQRDRPARFLSRWECGLEFGPLSDLQSDQLKYIVHDLLAEEVKAGAGA